MMRYMSLFWWNGGQLTSSIWAERDAEAAAAERLAHAAESLDMAEWLRLTDAQQRGVVLEYAAPRRQRQAA